MRIFKKITVINILKFIDLSHIIEEKISVLRYFIIILIGITIDFHLFL